MNITCVGCHDAQAVIDDLKAENERLREAMRDVLGRLLDRTPGDSSRLLSTLMRANLAAIIDDALDPDPNTSQPAKLLRDAEDCIERLQATANDVSRALVTESMYHENALKKRLLDLANRLYSP